MADTAKLNPTLKTLLEIGPVALFVLINYLGGKYGLDEKARFIYATGVLIGATLLALGIHFALTKEWPIMPLIMAFPAIVFGGLTIYFDDTSFFKMKPTFLNGVIGLGLLAGVFFKKNLLSYLFGGAMKLQAEGWRILTMRYAFFSFFLAAVNELVWRTQTTDFWVAFKLWGFVPLSMLFMVFQAKLIMKYNEKD